MPKILAATVTTVFCLCLLDPAPRAAGLTLEEVLERLDARSEKIRSLQAKIEIKNWIDLLEEFDRGESGEIFLLKDSGKTLFRREIKKPQRSVLVVDGQQAVLYQPTIKQAGVYPLGQRPEGAGNIFFAFLSDREAIEENYRAKLKGREEIRGARAYVLQLVPRDPAASKDFSKLVFYLHPEHWMPVRQVIHQRTGDYQRMDFLDIGINPKVDKSKFELDLPPDVKKKRIG